MNLIQAFLRNPVKVSVGVLIVGLFGTISLTRMPMQLTPEVQIPTVTVTTRWPGAARRKSNARSCASRRNSCKASRA